MKTALLAIALTTLLAAACAPATADGPTPAPAPPTATRGPAEPAPTVPPETPSVEVTTTAVRTWDGSVQRAIDAVLAGDVERLASLVTYREQGCIPGGSEFGHLECDEGVAAGTPIRFIWGPGCHGTDLREERIREHLQRWTDGVTGLYAVAVLPAHFGEAEHEGAKYRVIFEQKHVFGDGAQRREETLALAYLLNEAGEIVMIADYCATPPAELLKDHSQSPPGRLEVLGPPPATPATP
jgi:hypothetical protein